MSNVLKVPFTLEDTQQPAYMRHLAIIPTHFSAINTAPPGAGKSFTTMATLITYGYHLFLVCPSNAVTTWEEYTEKYGIDATIISYSKIIRKGAGFIMKTYNGKYEVTNKFKEILSKKILLVFDESQHAKNPKNATCKACKVLSNAVTEANNGSRILLLSATPADKQEYVESILKLMGIVKHDKLFNHIVGKRLYEMDGYGYEELFDYCNKINPTLSIQLRPGSLSAASIRQSMYKLYTNIVTPAIGFTMPKPKINAKFIGMNKFYNMEKDQTERIKEALELIKKCANFNNGVVTYTADSMSKIIQHMKLIEISKLELFKRLIKDTLDYVPNSKVIMYVWYDTTVDELMLYFNKYNPLRCDGKVDQNTKTKNRKHFQESNLNHRLMIAKATSFGDSVSLHDNNTLGEKFPRFTFINPSFFFNYIVQAAGRTYRVGTVSDVNVTLTYCKGTDENNVLVSLSKKGDITRDCIVKMLDDKDEIAEAEEEDDYENDNFIFVDEWPHVEE